MMRTHSSARCSGGRLATLAVAGGLALISMTACGGSSSGAATSSVASGGASPSVDTAAATAAGAVDGCKLLTAAEASTIVGFKYSSATDGGNGMCSYATTAAPIPLFIIVESNSGGSAAWNDQLQTLQSDSDSKPVTLTGVGDRAAGGGTEIGVQDGNYIIDVHGGDPSGTGAAFPKSIALAQEIITKLG